MIELGVTGAAGRMGRRIMALAHEAGGFKIVAALEHAGYDKLGTDAGILAGAGPFDVPVTNTLTTTPAVLIDFSLPESTEKWVDHCSANGIAMVIGTTGQSDTQRRQITGAARKIPIVFAANMSLGVNLLFKLAAEVAGILDDAYDIEIDETHHRFKRDAPSGTAMELARQIATAKGWKIPDCLQHGRSGDCPRQEKTIGMHALRLGDTIGIHNVRFASLGETVTLHHTAHSRDTFVRGALAAARWLATQKPGLYSMFDVLGL